MLLVTFRWWDSKSRFVVACRLDLKQSTHWPLEQWVGGSDPFYRELGPLHKNPTHGSGWMVQILSAELGPLHKNPTHGSGWMIQILSTENWARCTKIPPTAVGGWFRSFLQNWARCTKMPPTAVGGWFRSFLQRTGPAAQKSHPRQWVDGSDPFYRELGPLHKNATHGSGWMVQILSTENWARCTKIPPTVSGCMVQILSAENW